MNKKLEKILTGEYQFDLSNDREWFIENIKEIITTLYELNLITDVCSISIPHNDSKYDLKSINRLIKIIHLKDFYLCLKPEDLLDIAHNLIERISSNIAIDDFCTGEICYLNMVLNVLEDKERLKRINKE
jgi:hypothetical protein